MRLGALGWSLSLSAAALPRTLEAVKAAAVGVGLDEVDEGGVEALGLQGGQKGDLRGPQVGFRGQRGSGSAAAGLFYHYPQQRE